MRPKPLVPIASALALALAAVASPAQDDGPSGCATMVFAERLHPASLPGPAAGAGGAPETEKAARTNGAQASPLSARTLITTHFAIHYTLAPNVHRVKLTASDASLKATADSIRAALPGSLSAYKKDSTVHARLDSMGAPHPLYVQKAASFFERAFAYYDSLGMRMPQYASSSGTYAIPADSGHYAVDIADVNTAGNFSDPYYALTYPPDYGGYVLLENDFLYNATYDPVSDVVTGSPVRAYYPDRRTVYHDYVNDWESGLKVTASHEFYHAVQYAYVPVLRPPLHAWYELSATGMEERLAPEVNDYFQYLPYNIPNNHSIPVLTPPSTANYGNGIFHTFLTHALGAGFDIPVWEALRNNGNQLSAALITAVGSQARWDSLYAAYASALSLSGTPGAAASPLAFSPDMPQWPKPHFDTVPATARQLTVPALTFRVIRPPDSGSGIARLIGFEGGWRIDSVAGTGYRAVFFAGESLPVVKGTGVQATALVAANASFSQGGQALLAKTGAGLVPATNPVPRGQAALYFLAPEGGSADTLRVVSESGRRVANLPPEATDGYWSWNLEDLQGRRVPPGLYFFGTAALAPRPLVVLH